MKKKPSISAPTTEDRHRGGADLRNQQKNQRAKIAVRQKSALDTQKQQLTKLIADLPTKFISIPSAKIDSEINEALREICESLGLDIGVVWQWELAKPETFFADAYISSFG